MEHVKRTIREAGLECEILPTEQKVLVGKILYFLAKNGQCKPSKIGEKIAIAIAKQPDSFFSSSFVFFSIS